MLCFCFALSMVLTAQANPGTGKPLLRPSSGFFQADIAIQGKVSDNKGQPLAGVSVGIKGQQKTVVSNEQGLYQISAPENGTLVFTYIGFKTKEVPVNKQSTLNITLSESTSELDEVVVIGYQTVRKKDLTGATATISPELSNKNTANSVAESLQGYRRV